MPWKGVYEYSRPPGKQRPQPPPPISPREPVAFSIVDAVEPSILLPR
jgi:hypothetical protein